MKSAGLLQTDCVEVKIEEEELDVDEETIVMIKPDTKRRCRNCDEYGHNIKTCFR